MLFRTWVYLKMKSLQAVRQGTSNYLIRSIFSQKSQHGEKASRCISSQERGSLTVEAALVFPLFLFVLTALLYLFFFLQLQTEVGRALTDTARELSQDAYLVESRQEFAASAASSVYGKYYLEQYLGKRAAVGILKNGVDGISMLGSSWRAEDSRLILRASYQVILPPGLSWFHPIRVVQTKEVRGWTGFDGRRPTESLEGEELVYVTDYGVVYHKKLECRHLKLSIHQASTEEVKGLRNTNGAKYYPCEHCWKGEGTMTYITENGDRYHATLNCQGLVRGIHTVHISETGGLPPCSVCGG